MKNTDSCFLGLRSLPKGRQGRLGPPCLWEEHQRPEPCGFLSTFRDQGHPSILLAFPQGDPPQDQERVPY